MGSYEERIPWGIQNGTTGASQPGIWLELSLKLFPAGIANTEKWWEENFETISF